MTDPNRPEQATLTRRALLAGALPALACAACELRAPYSPREDAMNPAKPVAKTRHPVGFVAHGAPTLATDPVKGHDLTRWSQAMPRPGAILILSAHWEQAPVTLGTLRAGAIQHDFYGFPEPLYQTRYDSPGAPELAQRLHALLPGPVRREDRPMDHGVWVPLLHMYPAHDVPVLQLSMPTALGPQALLALGRQLAPLRDEGVLLLGSGNLVHNLRRVDWRSGPAPTWAVEFDQWAKERIEAQDLDALADVLARGPATALAHPTLDHYWPMVAMAGAAQGDDARFPVEGFEYGSISRRCVQWG